MLLLNAVNLLCVKMYMLVDFVILTAVFSYCLQKFTSQGVPLWESFFFSVFILYLYLFKFPMFLFDVACTGSSTY